MKKIPKRESARRNILYLAILFVAVIAIIALLPILKHPTPQFPPESPEVSAKRTSPENVYLALRQAVGATPNIKTKSSFANIKPLLLQDPIYKLVTPPMIKRIDILDPTGPALAKMREALEKPYFLWPIDWNNLSSMPILPPPPGPPPGRGPNPPKHQDQDNQPDSTFENDIAHFIDLGRLSIDEAKKEKDAGEKPYIYLGRFLDAVKLAMLISEDGTDLEKPNSFLSSAVPSLYDLLRGVDDDDTLRWLSEELTALDKRFPSLRNNIEFQMRVFDNPNMRLFRERGSEGAGVVERMFITFDTRKYKFWLAPQRDKILEAAEHTPEKFLLPKYFDTNFKVQDRCMRIHMLSGSASDFSLNWMTIHTWTRGANIMAALERYRLKNGRYPEELNALEPECFEKTPLRPINENTPFFYKREKDSYRLQDFENQGPNRRGYPPMVILRNPNVKPVIRETPQSEKKVSFK
jgi:hypothetical protein